MCTTYGYALHPKLECEADANVSVRVECDVTQKKLREKLTETKIPNM